MSVDAHHHFWNPARIPQAWMTDEHAAIARPFEPADLEPLLRATGVTRTVLVQSAACDDDTDYMFELADAVPWVGGIVAWCRLDDERLARTRLDELRTRQKLRGIRHLIHQEPDPHWLMQGKVEPALALLEERQLVLELPAVFPDHLDDVPELALRHPGLQIVIDHLGKPPLGTDSMARVGGAAAGSGRAPERPCEDLRAQHGASGRQLGRGRARTGGRGRSRRVRAPTGSSAAATGRWRF